MAISPSGRRQEPIHVLLMALALVLAAVAGAALGLVWQSAGLNEEEEPASAGQERLLTDAEQGG